ncbi:hypothetical protein XCR_1305 [Xanthomonas campestris pv. raphani 756C]|nr:hypothetical protein XCR_1305 [Xanthomonas campestris pv. raphani 756C]
MGGVVVIGHGAAPGGGTKAGAALRMRQLRAAKTARWLREHTAWTYLTARAGSDA